MNQTSNGGIISPRVVQEEIIGASSNVSRDNKKVKFEQSELKVVKEQKEDGGDKFTEEKPISNPKGSKQMPEVIEREATIIDYLKDVKARAEKTQMPTD